MLFSLEPEAPLTGGLFFYIISESLARLGSGGEREGGGCQAAPFSDSKKNGL